MTLQVPAPVYRALRALLERADYPLGTTDQRLVLDRVTLTPAPGSAVGNITVSTLLSSRTKEGAIDVQLNGELAQLDLPKAREVVGMLQEAIEAAVSDQLSEAAAAALVDFRELRQGSRSRVYPS